MDWQECITHRIVKDTSIDTHKITSIQEISQEKLKVALLLEDKHYYGKLPLLYETLRELLECLALQEGYKIYNHECYTAFLKEIMHESSFGDSFDKFRILRNGINYYGKKISFEEAQEIMPQMIEFIKKIQQRLRK